MAGDIQVNSLDLLRQYQGHLRKFADCVDAGVTAYISHLKSRKEELLRHKQQLEAKAERTLARLGNRAEKISELNDRFNFGQQDSTMIEMEAQRQSTKRAAIEAKLEGLRERYERQISICDDILNLTYSYGNRQREMADTANGSMTSIISTVEKYQEK